MKEKIKLGIGLPSYSLGTVASFPLECLICSPRLEHGAEHLEQANSLLAANCNILWAKALNAARQGKMTHFLMMHADVRPRANVMVDWFDKFLEQMEESKADVLAAIIPIKNTAGYTSVALDTNRWNPQRLTQHQVNRELPETWTADTLLFNTGLMLVDLRGKWTENPPFFTINDEIYRDENGDWQVHVEPEDWNFARMCHALKMRCFVTRVVPVDHFGIAMWSSDGVWGHEVDPECSSLSTPIQVTDASGKEASFSPAQDRAQLPKGFFEAQDIAFYRDIYGQLIPPNGQAAEIGVYRGRSIVSVADVIKQRNITVRCIDTFEPYREDKSTTLFEEFKATLINVGLEDRVRAIKSLSVHAAVRIPNDSLDFVFIDGDHSYESVRDDIKVWLPRVKKGGWIGGHDYATEDGVTKAVNEAFTEITGRPDSSIWLARR